MDNYVGKRLDGRYEVQEIIGVGGMSVVYKAYDNVADRIVAVKVLKEEFANNDEFRRRFKNESKAIALLSHPNIVKVYDVNLGEKIQYIVMEYIDGITLKEYINKQGAITWNDALFFMTQILHAVQHAHDKGIVHRDIKPQNIILLSTGDIKVTDFGIARFSRSETKTLTEQAIGSVHYIAPEQAKGEHTDERADIYSLGVVLYEMLSGRVPFEGDSAVSIALMQLQADATPLTQINPDIPLGLEQICNRAMQKNPQDRYQTATEMLFDIDEILRDPSKTFNYSYASRQKDTEPTKIIRKDEIKPVPVEEDSAPDYDEAEYAAEKTRKRRNITAIIIGIIVLVAAVVLIILGVIRNMNTTTYSLENFVGSSWDDVYAASQQDNYKYKLTAVYEKTDKEEPGVIISQDPEAGTKVLEGSTVTLTVAAAEDGIEIPNVFGYSEDQAKKELEDAGLVNFETSFISSENVDEGKVIYTDPKANTPVESDEKITIYISTGPSTTVIATKTVPDVYGLTQSGARAFLEKYGFKNVSFVTQDSTAPKNIVISQSPAAGETAQETASIKVIISSGTTTTTTERQVKASVNVKLPTVIDENGETATDTIIVSVDGAQTTKKTVKLDGSTFSISVPSKENETKEVTVELDGTGDSETKSTNGKDGSKLSFDFSDSSDDERSTTAAPPETVPAESAAQAQ